MTYQKYRFSPINTRKYKGDPTAIVARSSWEFRTFRWLDENPNVLEWSSEELWIPYICATDSKPHRYFPDLYIKFSNGTKYLVEIKPLHQTQEPKKKARVTRAYIEEVYTYGKNMSKWKAAKEYAEDRGYKFQVWSENELLRLGIRVNC